MNTSFWRRWCQSVRAVFEVTPMCRTLPCAPVLGSRLPGGIPPVRRFFPPGWDWDAFKRRKPQRSSCGLCVEMPRSSPVRGTRGLVLGL